VSPTCQFLSLLSLSRSHSLFLLHHRAAVEAAARRRERGGGGGKARRRRGERATKKTMNSRKQNSIRAHLATNIRETKPSTPPPPPRSIPAQTRTQETPPMQQGAKLTTARASQEHSARARACTATPPDRNQSPI
jgi:hypothetical protein